MSHFLCYEKDEILRQVVIESEDLGVILLRTYNELRKIKFLWEFLSDRGLDHFDSLTTSLNVSNNNIITNNLFVLQYL